MFDEKSSVQAAEAFIVPGPCFSRVSFLSLCVLFGGENSLKVSMPWQNFSEGQALQVPMISPARGSASSWACLV